MEIKVLGPGCHNCHKLEELTCGVLPELGISVKVDKITEINQITDYGVFTTPGFIVNGKLKAAGRVPRKEEIKRWIQEELNAGD